MDWVLLHSLFIVYGHSGKHHLSFSHILPHLKCDAAFHLGRMCSKLTEYRMQLRELTSQCHGHSQLPSVQTMYFRMCPTVFNRFGGASYAIETHPTACAIADAIVVDTWCKFYIQDKCQAGSVALGVRVLCADWLQTYWYSLLGKPAARTGSQSVYSQSCT